VNEPGGFITAHAPQAATPRVVDSALCATCDARPARFGGIRCQACLDTEGRAKRRGRVVRDTRPLLSTTPHEGGMMPTISVPRTTRRVDG